MKPFLEQQASKNQNGSQSVVITYTEDPRHGINDVIADSQHDSDSRIVTQSSGLASKVSMQGSNMTPY